MAVLKYKSGGEVKTLGVVKSGVSGVSSVNGKTGVVTGVYDNDNQHQYHFKSVNVKTGIITGLYDAENQPPYPVTSVNGKTGAIIGVYADDNPPPYPVTSVLGRTSGVSYGEAAFTIDEADTNKNISFNTFSSLVLRNESGSLPNGNSISRYLIFNEKVTPVTGGFIVTTLTPYLRASLIEAGRDSNGRGYIGILMFASGADVVLTNYHTVIYNLGNMNHTIYDVLRDVP